MRRLLLILVLLACRAGDEPLALSPDQPLRHDMGIVLPSSEAARALRVGAASRVSATEVWTPPPDAVQRLEQELPAIFSATLRRVVLYPAERPTDIGEYYRQYAGFVTASGEHGIFVQGLHRVIVDSFEARRQEAMRRSDLVATIDWRQHYIGVGDGGIMSFQAVYRIAPARFDSLWFNGRFEGPIEMRPR